MSGTSPAEQLRALTLDVAGLRESVDDVRGKFGDLRERVAALEDEGRNVPPPFHWGDLDEATFARREAAIREWVDQVLTPTHPHVSRRLPGCWFDHPHERALVTGTWLAWVGAYRAKGRKPTDPDDWASRRLPALDAALKFTFGEGGEPCEEHGSR